MGFFESVNRASPFTIIFNVAGMAMNAVNTAAGISLFRSRANGTLDANAIKKDMSKNKAMPPIVFWRLKPTMNPRRQAVFNLGSIPCRRPFFAETLSLNIVSSVNETTWLSVLSRNRSFGFLTDDF